MKRKGTAMACRNEAIPPNASCSLNSICAALSATIRLVSLLSARSFTKTVSLPLASTRARPISASIKMSGSVTSLPLDEMKRAF